MSSRADVEAALASEKNLGVRKGSSRTDRAMLLVVQVLEAQHRCNLLLAKGAKVDIDELNDSVRSLLSRLVEISS